MPKQSLLIFSVMLIVFSLTLVAGGGMYMFAISATASDDKYIHAALYWTGAFIGLVGLAGFLAGLVGVMGVILVRAAEMKELESAEEEIEVEDTAQEAL